MGLPVRSMARGLLAIPLVVASLTVTTPAAAQDDVCTALVPAEIEEVIGKSFGEGFGFEGYCAWETESGGRATSVSIILDAGPLDEMRTQSPGGTDIEVAGKPGYAVESTDVRPRAAVAAVAFAEPETAADALYIETRDPDLDILGAAVALMELAAPRIADMELELPADEPTDQPDACSIFEPEELSALVGLLLAESSYGPASCAWEGAGGSSSFASVSLSYATEGLAEMRSFFPGGEDVTVSGLPGYLYTVQLEDSSQAALVLDLGKESATIGVISPDPAFDAADTATALMSMALERGLTTSPEPEASASACSLLSAEEAADALGLDVTLDLLDYGTACSYFGGQGESGIDLLVSVLEAETVAFAAEAVGAEPVEGVADEAWWSEDLATFYARSGEEAYSVLVSVSDLGGEQRLAFARAVMEALLAKL